VSKKRPKATKRRSRLCKWLLVLPLMDIGPGDRLGTAGDDQLDQIAAAKRELELSDPLIELPEDGSMPTEEGLETQPASGRKGWGATIAELWSRLRP
jgi:hypothetical protein